MSTGSRSSTASASATVPQVAAMRKPGSASSSRPRLSRNRLWSSISSIRIGCGMGFPGGACVCVLLVSRAGHDTRELDDKTGAGRFRLIPKISPEGAHESAREIQAKSGGLGLMLERPEETLGMGHPAAGIGEANGDALVLRGGDNRKLAHRLVPHRALAVARQVEEHLQQALAIGPDQGQAVLRQDGKPHL